MCLGRGQEKLSPVLMVDEIEPCLPFWVDRLGFEKTTEVPEGERLGFVILARDGLEVMMQTRASVESDLPAVAETPLGGSILFMEVDDLRAALTTAAEHLRPGGVVVLKPAPTRHQGRIHIRPRRRREKG
jgi:catechol 2,3-dioxygenase-like lactoylglutathione lyase family enzyme